MPQSHACVHLHLVFSTKNRVSVIDEALAPDLYAYVGGICRDVDCALIAAGGMPDHVHYLVSWARTISIADLLRVVKANSSKWLHENGRPEISWQNGYGAFGVSLSQVPRVKDYIANQAEHHKTLSFQDEFRSLLKAHNIEYDERYVWD